MRKIFCLFALIGLLLNLGIPPIHQAAAAGTALTVVLGPESPSGTIVHGATTSIISLKFFTNDGQATITGLTFLESHIDRESAVSGHYFTYNGQTYTGTISGSVVTFSNLAITVDTTPVIINILANTQAAYGSYKSTLTSIAANTSTYGLPAVGNIVRFPPSLSAEINSATPSGKLLRAANSTLAKFDLKAVGMNLTVTELYFASDTYSTGSNGGVGNYKLLAGSTELAKTTTTNGWITFSGLNILLSEGTKKTLTITADTTTTTNTITQVKLMPDAKTKENADASAMQVNGNALLLYTQAELDNLAKQAKAAADAAEAAKKAAATAEKAAAAGTTASTTKKEKIPNVDVKLYKYWDGNASDQDIVSYKIKSATSVKINTIRFVIETDNGPLPPITNYLLKTSDKIPIVWGGTASGNVVDFKLGGYNLKASTTFLLIADASQITAGSVYDAYYLLSDIVTEPASTAANLPLSMPWLTFSDRESTKRKVFIEDAVTKEKRLAEDVDTNLVKRLRGQILLQVESNGEAWYVEPEKENKIYLRNGAAAYQLMRTFGLGITNENIKKIPIGLIDDLKQVDQDQDGLNDLMEQALGTDPIKSDTDGDGHQDGEEVRNGYAPLGTDKTPVNESLRQMLKGKILLQVENKGQAWYINPSDGKRYYMSNGEAAYQMMRKLSLGISDENIRKIPVGE